jgi:hypothetical protein
MKTQKRSIKNKKHLEIQKYLVVSTAHITEEENEYLRDEVYSQLSVYTTDYGHSIFVPHENLKKFEGIVGKNVLSLLKIAYKNGCCYLKLDRDGFVYDDLPKFDW